MAKEQQNIFVSLETIIRFDIRKGLFITWSYGTEERQHYYSQQPPYGAAAGRCPARLARKTHSLTPQFGRFFTQQRDLWRFVMTNGFTDKAQQGAAKTLDAGSQLRQEILKFVSLFVGDEAVKAGLVEFDSGCAAVRGGTTSVTKVTFNTSQTTIEPSKFSIAFEKMKEALHLADGRTDHVFSLSAGDRIAFGEQPKNYRRGPFAIKDSDCPVINVEAIGLDTSIHLFQKARQIEILGRQKAEEMRGRKEVEILLDFIGTTAKKEGIALPGEIVGIMARHGNGPSRERAGRVKKKRFPEAMPGSSC
jgi:hypothetical protein